jgi:plasmid stabilization system protein ParE
MRLTYPPEAEAELLEAVQFYERRVAGLGASFLREFESAISAIEEAPERWQLMEGGLRRFLMHRFPYGIYYRVEGEELRILVVKHHRRHPDYWKHRLNQ